MTPSATAPTPWRVVAQNLPEHARNPIHTDEGARAAGFPAGLVAGVTTYAYLTHPLAAAWGVDWVRGGGGEVRFRSPVFAGEAIDCVPVEDDDGWVVEARGDGDDRARAVLAARRTGDPVRALRAGEALPARRVQLVGELSDEYGARAGDDLDLYRREGIVHPAVWPALANHVVHVELARGPWIHTRSRIDHHDVARVGSWADVTANVVERFQRSGERAVLDVAIDVDGTRVATLEHEAIVELPRG